jgi:hypothetical protein
MHRCGLAFAIELGSATGQKRDGSVAAGVSHCAVAEFISANDGVRC